MIKAERIIFGACAALPIAFSAPAHGQSLDQLETMYSIQCASPANAMMQMNCAMQRQQLDSLKQQRLAREQDETRRAAQEARDAEAAAANAQLQASMAQSLDTIRANRAAASGASSSTASGRRCVVPKNWCNAPPGGACDAERAPKC